MTRLISVTSSVIERAEKKRTPGSRPRVRETLESASMNVTIENVSESAALPLREAIDRLTTALTRSVLRGDVEAAGRLRQFVELAEREADYAGNVDRGMPMIERRTDRPIGRTIGWVIANDPAVQAMRRIVMVPPAPRVAASA